MARSTFWRLLLGSMIGIAAGVGGYTFVYARGSSYLTDDPSACANCHIMGEQYAGWLKGPHRSVAVCNDCHTPPGFIAKYATKASNGWHHSFAFTTGRFHEPIQIGERNREIAELSCRKCHSALVATIEGPHSPGREIRCLQCHSEVGHL